MQKILITIAITAFITCMQIAAACWKLNIDFWSQHTAAQAFASLFIFDRFLVEGLAIAGLLTLLFCAQRPFRILGNIVLALYITASLIQAGSMIFGGEYLSRLALENISHAEFFLNVGTISGILVFLSLMTGLALYFEKISKREPIKVPWMVVAGLWIAASVIRQAGFMIPDSIKEQRNLLLLERNLAHTSPLIQLQLVMANKHHRTTKLKDAISFDDIDRSELKRLGLAIDASHEFPFIKDKIYKSAPPFSGKAWDEANKPNILVFLNEGISARSLAIYGEQRYPKLTDNISDFSQRAMVVDGYYNHTAASYRGMKGQLCSIFPKTDGTQQASASGDVNYLCLNNLFKDQGYATAFFNAHSAEDSYVDEMMTSLKFETVYNAKEISSQWLNGEKNELGWALSDRQFFSGLIEFFKQREGQANKPLFMGLYNIQTHANVDVQGNGVRYGDGKNNALNTIHNFDHQFGRFWEYFKTSEFAKNTIIVFTSDHCHYTEHSFVNAFDNPDYQKIFIDRIPLIIYDPRQTLPSRYDATVSSSISLAPSLMHLLGFPQHAAPFFGTSIFEPEHRRDYALAAIGEDVYLINEDMVHTSFNSRSQTERINLLTSYLKFAHEMEVANRLWPATQQVAGSD